MGGERHRPLAVVRRERVPGGRGRVGQLGDVPEPLALGPKLLLGVGLEASRSGDERAQLVEPVALGVRTGGELGVAAAGGE